MTRRHWLFLGVGFWGWLTLAAATPPPPPRLEDFAYGAALELDAGGALYALTLPDAVYAGVVRGDLGDLRVFNGQGEVVPHRVRIPPAPVVMTPEPLSVPFSLLPAAPEGSGQAPPVRVQTASGTTLVEVGSGTPPSPVPPSYLLNLEQLPRDSLRSLRLAWGAAPAQGFVTPVRLDASEDLIHWIPAGEGALADLEVSGQRLQRDTLIPHRWGSYLRLSGKQPIPPLTQIEALLRTPNGVELERRWRRVTGSPAVDTAGYAFDSGGQMAVDRLRFHLPQPNTLAAVELATRATPQGAWMRRFSGALYDLTLDGVRLHSDDIAVPTTSGRFWRLTVATGGGGLGEGMPILEVGWVPHQLLFVARGEGPYRLVWGSARIFATVPEAALLEQLALNHAPQRARAG
ncbi:MAG: DUF3999 domain-containing protein, partial [Pseudomonadota bacterium]